MNIFKKAIKEAKEITESFEKISTPAPEPEEEWIWVEGYKGTDKGMCCRGYQYELGKQYNMPEDVKIEECENGFHLCLNLYDVFKYYQVGNSNRFFKVKALVRNSDKDRYGLICHEEINGYISCYRKDKLVAKSIIFISELATDEILENTDAQSLPEEYKQVAIECGIEFAVNNYQINTLIEDGYSHVFATHIVKDNKFDIAHIVGSQKDLSMDVKVLAILYHTKEITK